MRYILKRRIRKEIEIVIRLALALAACFPALPAGADDFTVVGPGGGGAMYNATINPHDSNEVLVSCDMTGSYISHDGGRSWRMFNLRGTVRFFAFDPLRPKTIYAGATGLWRSTNDGVTWSLVWPTPAAVGGIRMNTDHADETILSSEGPVGQVTAFAIDPSDSRSLVAGAMKDGKAAVYISMDQGATWDKQYDLPGSARRIWIDPNSDKRNRTLYIGGEWGVAVRSNGGWQSRPVRKGVTFTDISGGFAAANGVMLYATSEAGIFLSRDGCQGACDCSQPESS